MFTQRASVRIAAPCARQATAVCALYVSMLSDPMLSERSRGTLCFGATRGPKSWIAARDGEWAAGYWVELEGGADDGLAMPLPKESIAKGLQAGDAVEIYRTGAGVAVVPLKSGASGGGAVSSPDQAKDAASLERLRRALRDGVKPLGISLAILLMAALGAMRNCAES